MKLFFFQVDLESLVVLELCTITRIHVTMLSKTSRYQQKPYIKAFLYDLFTCWRLKR